MKKIRIFLSRPNPFTENQQYFIDKLICILKKKNIECFTLQAAEYSPYEVITSLNEMIQRSYGMMILAFGQTYIEKGIRKKDAEKNSVFFSANEIYLKNKWMTSIYCHIEGMLAVNMNIPILSIIQKDVRIEGMLKEDSHLIQCKDFTLDSKKNIDEYLESSDFKFKLDKWITLVERKYKNISNRELRY